MRNAANTLLKLWVGTFLLFTVASLSPFDFPLRGFSYVLRLPIFELFAPPPQHDSLSFTTHLFVNVLTASILTVLAFPFLRVQQPVLKAILYILFICAVTAYPIYIFSTLSSLRLPYPH
ncbi:MAG: hypothetical protein K8S54_06175 [Spirochaetia bacterium]|nr:hypothetical protein [Spirochaetia bacterium]